MSETFIYLFIMTMCSLTRGSSPQASSPNLTTMPAEIIDGITKHVEDKSLLNLAATCRKMDAFCAPSRAKILLRGVDAKFADFQRNRDWTRERNHLPLYYPTLGTYRLYRRAVDVERAPIQRAMYGTLAVPAIVASLPTALGLLVGAYGLLGVPALARAVLRRSSEELLMPLLGAMGPLALLDDLLTSPKRQTRHEQRRALRRYAEYTKALTQKTPLGSQLTDEIAQRVSDFVISMNNDMGLRMRHPEKAVRG